MKIFTRKQLLEHDERILREQDDRRFIGDRLDRLDRNNYDLSRRIDRLERRLDMDPKPVCDGMPKEAVNHE